MKKASYPDPVKASPEEWDGFLGREKYHLGLLDFARCLVNLIRVEDPRYGCDCIDPDKIPDILKDGRRSWREYFVEEIKRKERLVQHISDELRPGLAKFGFPTTDEFIIEAYKLELFFERLDSEIERCEETIERVRIWTRRGHPVALKNKVAFVWAQVMRDNKHRIKWGAIEALIRWFYEKIQGSRYSTIFDPCSAMNAESFREEYNLVIKDKKRKEDLIKLAERTFFSYTVKSFNRHFRIEFNKECVDILRADEKEPALKFFDGTRYSPEVDDQTNRLFLPMRLELAIDKYDALRSGRGIPRRFRRGY